MIMYKCTWKWEKRRGYIPKECINMIYLILGIVYGVCLFLCYRQGFKDGLNVKQTNNIPPIIKPSTGENKQESDYFIEGLNNILAYNGTPQEVSDD
jgi:hypothetical protein